MAHPEDLQDINRDYILNHPADYKEIVLQAVKKNAQAIQYVHPDYIKDYSTDFDEITQASKKKHLPVQPSASSF